MIISIIAYIFLAGWYLFGNEQHQRFSMFISVCMSSYLAYSYWYIDNFFMAIYIVMGMISTFFYWISIEPTSSNNKQKYQSVAIVLAILLGGFGIHKLYLKNNASWLLYILFCWTMIPSVIAIIEAVYLLITQLKSTTNSNPIGATHKITPVSSNKQNSQPKQSEYFAEYKNNYQYEDSNIDGAEARNGNNLNYRHIRICGCNAQAIGTVDDFSIIIKNAGQTYTFKAKDGTINSFRSSSMRETKKYEVN